MVGGRMVGGRRGLRPFSAALPHRGRSTCVCWMRINESAPCYRPGSKLDALSESIADQAEFHSYPVHAPVD